MPSIRGDETLLSSSIIIMPTSNYDNLRDLWSQYSNIPDFNDLTLHLDIDEDGNRVHPLLSFVQIEGIHDGSLYLIDESGESTDLGDELYKLIEQGTQFKLQYIQIAGYGLQYTSFYYDSTGLLSQISDGPLYIPPNYIQSGKRRH